MRMSGDTILGRDEEIEEVDEEDDDDEDAAFLLDDLLFAAAFLFDGMILGLKVVQLI